VVIALTVVGLVPWLVLVAAGSVLVLTGRHLPFGMPPRVREGWPLRLGGLVCCAIGFGYVSVVVRAGGMYSDAVLGSYIILAAGAWYNLRQGGVASG
jgi:hypothetical protein